MIGFITGSGNEKFEGEKKIVPTKWGDATVLSSDNYTIISRHGENHEFLPHHINYRANLAALKKAGCTAVVSFSVAGSLNHSIPLGVPVIINDLFFPENKLHSGETCSIFDKPGEKERGHLIAGSLYNTQLSESLSQLLPASSFGTYVHSLGPRFNTQSEIKFFQQVGGDVVSQTGGPEAVIANELELPFTALCFTVDYANGVSEVPTSIEELNSNILKSSEVFLKVITELPDKTSDIKFENFIYRF